MKNSKDIEHIKNKFINFFFYTAHLKTVCVTVYSVKQRQVS